MKNSMNILNQYSKQLLVISGTLGLLGLVNHLLLKICSPEDKKQTGQNKGITDGIMKLKTRHIQNPNMNRVI